MPVYVNYRAGRESKRKRERERDITRYLLQTPELIFVVEIRIERASKIERERER